MNCLKLMPISPMLCEPFDISKLSTFDFNDYLMEVKWDGTRAVSFKCENETRLQNRRFVDLTKRYPEIKIHLKGATEAILDGEVVVMVNGIPDFDALQHREHVIDDMKIERLMKTYPASYVVFDILYLDGRDVTYLPLLERKKILKDILIETENVFICDYIFKEGKKFFELCVERGLEGIVAKKTDSPYVIGRRSGYWKKIKKEDTIDAIIVGYTSEKREISALVLGIYHQGDLRYLAKAASGLKEKDIKLFLDIFKLIHVMGKSPLKEVPNKLRREKIKWIEPVLVAEIKFMEKTKSMKLRSPRFVRLRTDKSPFDCVME